MNELEIVDGFDKMNKVVAEMLKGNNPSAIAKNLDISRAQVLELIDKWKNIVNLDNRIQDRAREALSAADQHYAMIINEAWDTVEEAGANSQLNIKAQALKLIADVEGKRIDMLQKAGLLENTDIGNQIIETERKQKILIDILKDISGRCESCKIEVTKRISEVTGKVEAINID
jgi:hypothetical protein